MRERFQKFEEAQLEEVRSKGKKEKKEEEKNVKNEPFWFPDGKYKNIFFSLLKLLLK